MSAVGPLVLLIEDELQVRRFLKASLLSQGYRFLESSTAEEGLRQAVAYNPDLFLLDLGLPDLDGLEVLQRLRAWSKAPVIVLSAREQEQDKIAALDSGADDYLTKPFGAGELLARMRVALRHAGRSEGEGEAALEVGELRIDLARRQVLARGEEVHLTPIEYKLFATLMKHAGKVLTHRFLLKEVWGPSHVDQMQYLRVYMVQLRHKLERDPARPRYLMTEPGVGYRLRTDTPPLWIFDAQRGGLYPALIRQRLPLDAWHPPCIDRRRRSLRSGCGSRAWTLNCSRRWACCGWPAQRAS